MSKPKRCPDCGEPLEGKRDLDRGRCDLCRALAKYPPAEREPRRARIAALQLKHLREMLARGILYEDEGGRPPPKGTVKACRACGKSFVVGNGCCRCLACRKAGRVVA